MNDIPGYEGLYAATEDGRIWSYPKWRNSRYGKWLKPIPNPNGYMMVCLNYLSDKVKNAAEYAAYQAVRADAKSAAEVIKPEPKVG